MLPFSYVVTQLSEGQKSLKIPTKWKTTAVLPVSKYSSEGWMKMYCALWSYMTDLCKAIPACAESFCIWACCNAPQRQFDLQSRCFTKIITICIEAVCDKNKNIPKSVLQLRLCLPMFFQQALKEFCFLFKSWPPEYSAKDLYRPSCNFIQRPTPTYSGSGIHPRRPAGTGLAAPCVQKAGPPRCGIRNLCKRFPCLYSTHSQLKVSQGMGCPVHGSLLPSLSRRYKFSAGHKDGFCIAFTALSLVTPGVTVPCLLLTVRGTRRLDFILFLTGLWVILSSFIPFNVVTYRMKMSEECSIICKLTWHFTRDMQKLQLKAKAKQ